ncbi:hypothetical protein Tco_0713123 [Tanacetum coccineum]
MGIDPRQIVAGILTVTMFLMLGNMIKRQHFDAPISHHVNRAGSTQNFDDNKDSGAAFDSDSSWKEEGATGLKQCWSKSVLEEPEDAKGYVTFSLTNGPEYHVSQIADAVVVARYLKATLVIPDIRGSQPGDWRPTEGYEEQSIIPEIVANNFEHEAWVINLVMNKLSSGHDKEDSAALILLLQSRIHSTMRVPNVPISRLSLCFFLFLSREQPELWLEKEPLDTIHTWTIYSPLKLRRGELLDKMPRECLKIIESKSKVRQTRAKAVIAKVNKKNQASAPAPAPAPVKAVELSCVTCGGAHSHQNCPATHGDVYRDNISEYVSQAAAANYNQVEKYMPKPRSKNTCKSQWRIRTDSLSYLLLLNTACTSVLELLTVHLLSKEARRKIFIRETDLKVVWLELPEERVSVLERLTMRMNISVLGRSFEQVTQKTWQTPAEFLIPCEFKGMLNVSIKPYLAG